MHISGRLVQSATSNVSKCQNGTLKFTVDELRIVKILLSDSKVTQKKIAELTGLSERTVKRKTVEMQQKGFIARENGKRNGRWIVLAEIFQLVKENCITGYEGDAPSDDLLERLLRARQRK